jgi:Fur family transcriptional regulator, peroxide stress response regulator
LDEITKTKRIEAYHRVCREQGLRSTVQKRAILEAVLDLDNHPTADQVHEAVTRENPDISRTTVYRALESFSRFGLITKACHPGSATRYDRNVDIHHHLICLNCDAVIDISDAGLDRLTVPDTSGFDFDVHDFRVQLRGICGRCRKKGTQGGVT